MLDIAESVFHTIAEKLKSLGKSVRGAFGKACTIIDEFEGEENVEILSAQKFLECLKNIELTQLSQLEVACLMRVLTKPEIQHSVVLNELQMVMENFGLTVDKQVEQPSKEELRNKKQKLSKQKMIKELINTNNEVYETIMLLMQKIGLSIDTFRAMISKKVYIQAVKYKKKETQVELIQLAELV